MLFTQGTEGSITVSPPVGKHSNAENRIGGKCRLKRDSSTWALGLSLRHTPSPQLCLHTGQGRVSNASAFTQPKLETVTQQLQPLPSRRDLFELLPLLLRGEKQPLLCVDQQGEWEECAWVTCNKFRRTTCTSKNSRSLIQTGHEIDKKARKLPEGNLSDWQCNVWGWTNTSALSLGTKPGWCRPTSGIQPHPNNPANSSRPLLSSWALWISVRKREHCLDKWIVSPWFPEKLNNRKSMDTLPCLSYLSLPLIRFSLQPCRSAVMI